MDLPILSANISASSGPRQSFLTMSTGVSRMSHSQSVLQWRSHIPFSPTTVMCTRTLILINGPFQPSRDDAEEWIPMQIPHSSMFSSLYNGSMASSPRALLRISPMARSLTAATVLSSQLRFSAFAARASNSSLAAVSPAFMGVIKAGKDDHIVSFRMIIRDNHAQ